MSTCVPKNPVSLVWEQQVRANADSSVTGPLWAIEPVYFKTRKISGFVRAPFSWSVRSMEDLVFSNAQGLYWREVSVVKLNTLSPKMAKY